MKPLVIPKKVEITWPRFLRNLTANPEEYPKEWECPSRCFYCFHGKKEKKRRKIMSRF